MTVSAELWLRVKYVVEAALDAPPDERAALVQRLAEGDNDVVVAAIRLLDAAGHTGGVLDGFAIDAISGSAPPSPFSLTGRTLGAWRVEREVGRGGMGIVYEGRHVAEAFTKRVAIKTLAMGLGSPDVVWRFSRERRILATLDHPNIAQLLDGGATDEGVPYLVMEYVTGERIDRWCDARRLTIPQRLDLFRHVCSAVQFAHTRLVVHRDLKPGNILVTDDGVVKLLDFGVAKLLSGDDVLSGDDTRSRAVPLTPAYASPEQVRGDPVSTATDVYALGVLLFVLLTGRTPFVADQRTPTEMLAMVTGEPARAPSTVATEEHARACLTSGTAALRRALAGELDAIVLKALRKEADRRYASVEALSDDVLRSLRGDPVRARPDTWGYRARRFVRRRRALVAGLAVAAVGLTTGTGVSMWQARRAFEEARRSRLIAAFLQQVVGAGDLSAQVISSPKLGPGATIAEMLDSAAAWAPRALAEEPDVRALVHGMVASALAGQERYREALVQYDSAVAVAEAAGGSGAFVTATALESRARVRLMVGLLAPADSDAARALALFQSMGDTTSWLHGDALLRVGQVAMGRSDVEGARRAALAALAATTGPDSGSILVRARGLTMLGYLLAQSSPNLDSSRVILRRAMATFDSLGSIATRDEAELMLTVIGIPGMTTPREADSLAREALLTNERAAGPNSALVASTLWNLAARQRVAGDLVGEGRYIDRAMAIVAKRPELDASVRQYVQMEYARKLWRMARIDSAVLLAARVLDERRSGPPALAAEAGQLLGALLVIRGRDHHGGEQDFRSADSVLTATLALFESVFPRQSYWPQATAGSLVELYSAWRRPERLEWALSLLPEAAQEQRRSALAKPGPHRSP